MPEITVKHNVKDAKPPEREVLPGGCYHSVIVKVTAGITNFQPPLQKITIEYQITKTDKDSIVNEEPENKYAGRSVWQDYVLEPGTKEHSNQREAFRMQQLMAATKCPYKLLDGGGIAFNTDHLMSKGVKITVIQKSGKLRAGDPPNTPIPIFNNVDRVDSMEDIKDEDLL